VVFHPLTAPDRLHHALCIGPSILRDEDHDRLPDSLARRISEHPLRGAIPRCDAKIQVLTEDRIVRRFNNGGQSPSGARRRLSFDLASPPFCNVLQDTRRSNYPARTVMNGRNRHRHWNESPILPSALSVVVFNLLTALDRFDHGIFFAPSTFRDDDHDRFPDNFARRISEHPLRGAIPRCDAKVQTLTEDRILRRFNNGSQ
jgi:hypothetical protein